MKKVFNVVFIFIAISLLITLTQISCQKSVAQENATSQDQPANLVLLGKMHTKELLSSSTTVDSLGQPTITKTTEYNYEYFTMNVDGSNLRKIPINLPTGLYVWGDGHLTHDAKTIVFNVIDKMGGGSSQEVNSYIYSCSLDGSNLKKLIDGSYAIQGVY